MDLQTLASKTVWGKGRQQFNRWTQKLRSGRNRDFSEMSYFALVRGAGSKTDLSLVDRIELAKAYQPMTGKQI